MGPDNGWLSVYIYIYIMLYDMHINNELMKRNRHILNIQMCIQVRHDYTI